MNQNVKAVGLILSLGILIGSVCGVRATEPHPIMVRMDRLTMDHVLNREPTLTLISELDLIEAMINEQREAPDKKYWLARIAFQRGEFSESLKDLDQAEFWFDKSQDLVASYLEEEETSDAHRLLGDTYMRLMNYKGLLYQIANGMSMSGYQSKALELDPENWKAVTSKALIKIHSPSFAGGDIQEGIDLLDLVIQKGDISDVYMGYYFKSVAHQQAEDFEKALTVIEQGLLVFPGTEGALNRLKRELILKQREAKAEGDK